MGSSESPATSETFKYLRQKRIALGQAIQPVKKVYLDTKYWILLRDVRLGRTQSIALTTLLQRLERLVADGRVICPFNSEIFIELVKQSDRQTLTATARLIDDLCQGVCIVHEAQRIEMEILHFIESCRKGNEKLYPLEVLVWTCPTHWLGCPVPEVVEFSPSMNARLQRDYADFSWKLTITELLEIVGKDGMRGILKFFPDISKGLNEGKFANLDEHDSFKSMFMSEISGILDVYKDNFPSLFQYLYERDTGNTDTGTPGGRAETARLLKNVIYNAFRFNRIRLQMPTLRVGAALHAAFRWDKKRRYKPNDCRDIHHAAAAIPYCDIMLTERSLAHLAQDNNLQFGNLFPCKLVASPEDALSEVEKLAA